MGFTISVDASSYPNATTWYADFNFRYFAWFLPIGDPWAAAFDLSPSGEAGTLTVELYDVDLNLLKRCTISTTLRNDHQYRVNMTTCQISDLGQGWVKFISTPGSLDVVKQAPAPQGWVRFISNPGSLAVLKQAPVPQGWVKFISTPGSLQVTKSLPEPPGWTRFINQPSYLPVGMGIPEEPAPIPASAKLVYSHTYDAGNSYTGKAEQCIARVTVPLPDQVFAATWVTGKITDTFASEVQKQGGQMLEVKIYEDTQSATFSTDFYVLATAAPAPVPAGAVGFPFPWAVVIPLILLVLLVVSFTWLIIQIKEIDWKSPAALLVGGVGIAIAAGGLALLLVALGSEKAPKEVK